MTLNIIKLDEIKVKTTQVKKHFYCKKFQIWILKSYKIMRKLIKTFNNNFTQFVEIVLNLFLLLNNNF